MCGATSPTHHHPTLSHPNAKGRVTAHSPPPPSPIQTRRAASPPTRHHLPLPFRREGPRHPPLATTSLSHSDAKGRVTAHSPPPPSPIQTRRAASPPTRHHLPLPSKPEGPRNRPISATSLSQSDAKGRVTAHSPPPPSPIQTRRAASPPTRHHLPLPFRREGTRHPPLAPSSLSPPPHPLPPPFSRKGPGHRPLATPSLSHSDAKGRVTAHSPPPPSPIQTRRAGAPTTRQHLPPPFRREATRHHPP